MINIKELAEVKKRSETKEVNSLLSLVGGGKQQLSVVVLDFFFLAHKYIIAKNYPITIYEYIS